MSEKPKDFVHLHVHSHYSLLNAIPTPKELAAAAKADGQTALAITDNGALYGAIDFYQACHKEGIKPIIGIDAFLAPRRRFDKETGIDKPRARLVLLAKNNDGYKNLIQMVTLSNTEGFYYRPRIDHDLLEKYGTDLICILPSFSGETTLHLKNNDQEKAEAELDWYKKVFKDDLYLEITHHQEILDHEDLQEKIKSLAKKTDTPLVAAQDIYYMNQSDAIAREVMIKIQNGGSVDTSIERSEDFSFKTKEEMINKFEDTPEAIKNTVKVAEMCNVEIVLGQEAWMFPDFIIESGKEPDEELKDLAYKGVAWRGHDINNKEIKERLDYELEVIKKKGYAKYFLAVGDLLREARERKILTTIRGSVAGSYTTYVLGITNVDPLEYKLPFERFLNPERPSAPDIDMDYADNRRDEIIEYAKDKYGHDKVAQIGTFGTMMARAAVRDVARALGHSYSLGDTIAKLIPMGSQGFPMTIEKALEIEPELKKLYQKDPESREVIDLAQKIEGRARHVGVHAAGVVIAPKPLNNYVPIQLDQKTGKYITQYEMRSVGEDGVGLLKFDFLGIKNLSILADAVQRVKAVQNIDVDIEHIPLDDKKTFTMLARGETMGLFQLNGSGMTAFLKQLQPTTIHDINAMVALYRPGPMESIPQYIERKHNPSLVTFLDPRMEDILDRSFGVITYQDDVMMISIKLAGYSWLEADKLRKAMGKKIPEVMAAEKDKLLEGLVKHGMTENKALRLWQLIEPFAAYGFNKCLPASARILDTTTGIPTTIEKILSRKKTLNVASIDSVYKIQSTKASQPFKNGKKDIFEITTRSGRKIKATGNHPFLLWQGWTRLDRLKVKDRIAVPRILPAPKKPSVLKNSEAATLGYLIAEGNLCHPHGVYFYSKQPNEIQDFIKHAKIFKNSNFTINTSKSAASVYVGQKESRKGNTLRKWLEKLELINQKASDKSVPDVVFGARNDVVACFLGKLWQGDGTVSIKNYQTYYATSSDSLAHDVQHLLLRFGILSTIHHKTFKYRGGTKEGWAVVVTGHDNLFIFSKHIGKHLIGEKQSKLKELVSHSKKRKNALGRGTSDTIPAEIIETIRSKMQAQGISARELANKTGIAERLLYRSKNKTGYTRETLKKIAVYLQSIELRRYVESDVFWDSVASIKKVGREMTYDLTVPELKNFIADDFFVHNSHAASYGLVAYQTAYMKANYPVEYMSAVLTADSGDTEKISEIIHECKRMGIEVLPPDINESFSDFTVVSTNENNTSPGNQNHEKLHRQGEFEQSTETYQVYDEGDAENSTKSEEKFHGSGRIRFGLTTIKNFGEGITETIIKERKENGPFTSLTDFLTRIHDKNLNKKSLEALVKVGALSQFGERGTLFHNLDNMLAFNKEQSSGKTSGQDSLFGGIDTAVNELTLEEAAPLSTEEKLVWEKELLGVYVSGHPLDQYTEELKKRGDISLIKADGRNGIPVVTAGMVETVRELLTKKGERMAFVKLANKKDEIEMVAFPGVFQTARELLIPGTCVAVKGKLNIRNDEPSILVDKIKSLDPTQNKIEVDSSATKA